jgi:hypothetical protein
MSNQERRIGKDPATPAVFRSDQGGAGDHREPQPERFVSGAHAPPGAARESGTGCRAVAAMPGLALASIRLRSLYSAVRLTIVLTARDLAIGLAEDAPGGDQLGIDHHAMMILIGRLDEELGIWHPAWRILSTNPVCCAIGTFLSAGSVTRRRRKERFCAMSGMLWVTSKKVRPGSVTWDCRVSRAVRSRTPRRQHHGAAR